MERSRLIQRLQPPTGHINPFSFGGGSHEISAVALDAAGKVHTDIKRGFIRAETFGYNELHELGSEKALKAAGKIRLEGKEYVVQDGDIINFRFNV